MMLSRSIRVLFFLFLFSFSHLLAEVSVLAFSGSVRKESLNKKLVKEAAKVASSLQANVHVIDLKDYPMPLYDGDLEVDQGVPENAQKLSEMMRNNQFIFIASPDYNASVSPLLKNTLDWMSRVASNPFKGKTFILFSASPGSSGGARGLVNLRAILEILGGRVYSQNFSVPRATHVFDKQGNMNEQARKQLHAFLKKALT